MKKNDVCEKAWYFLDHLLITFWEIELFCIFSHVITGDFNCFAKILANRLVSGGNIKNFNEGAGSDFVLIIMFVSFSLRFRRKNL